MQLSIFLVNPLTPSLKFGHQSFCLSKLWPVNPELLVVIKQESEKVLFAHMIEFSHAPNHKKLSF